MKSVHLAVILLTPYGGDHSLALKQNIAGVPLLKRLLLTLQRAGIKQFLILSHQLDPKQIHKETAKIEKDSRLTSPLQWHDRAEYFQSPNIDSIQTLTQGLPFILVNGNLVTHQKVIQRFIEAGQNNFEEIYSLEIEGHIPGGMFLLPSDKFSTLDSLTENQASRAFAKHIVLPADKNFWVEVQEPGSIIQADKNLLHYNKHHYHQFMDIWVNSVFSRPICALLVKTPLTPNMLSLFGLFIGLLAGCAFAQGNYLGGLAGGLLMVLTAIGDCCDGDIARLKLLESDSGEKLDTACDNIINVFVFTGMMLGLAQSQGWINALIPFTMLALGGGWIFTLIYFPKGGKGSSFNDSKMYDIIQTLASRNFIYIIFVFSIFGYVEGFLWLAGIGSLVFALILFMAKRRMLKETYAPS